MRLPQHLVESLCFTFPSVDVLVATLRPPANVVDEMRGLAAKGLPPIVSQDVLATMLGVNAGILWSFARRPHKHYNAFNIPKGNGHRVITAPRVGLKVFQAWLAHHLSRSYAYPEHVFGFVPGRSHVSAALVHRDAEWALSVDIQDFFSTTPARLVNAAFSQMGYSEPSALLLTSLTTLDGVLPQGAPTSPSLSNLCFKSIDASLADLAGTFGANLTRYADDIVLSGSGAMPAELLPAIQALFLDTPWSLREDKTEVFPLKGRIKIHGLVIKDGRVRLSKGYRNKLRTYAHVLRTRDAVEHEASLRGHLAYAQHVVTMTEDGHGLNLNVPPPLQSREAGVVEQHKTASELANSGNMLKSVIMRIRSLLR